MNGEHGKPNDASARLTAVQARIRAASEASGRPQGSVRLLAVSKTFDSAHVIAMADAGQDAFGENYLQEALDKQARIADERPALALEWHFIGPVQSNKTRQIATHFAWVHSVERLRIAERLSAQRPEEMGALQVCLQVNVDDEPSKSGCTPAEAPELAVAIASLPRLALRGLMAIPAPREGFDAQLPAFERVKALHEAIRERLMREAPETGARFDTLSMGMTGDLEAAIAQGATIVRIGTALFGQRKAHAG